MKLLILFYFILGSLSTFAQEENKDEFIKEIYLGTNFASLYRQQGPLKKGKYVTTNPYINIEGEFSFHSRFAIRIPIGFGLNSLDGKVIEGGDLPSHWFDKGPFNSEYLPDFWYQNGPTLDYSRPREIQCNLRCSYRPYYYLRPHYLKYQIGVFPKVTLRNWEKASLSVTAGVNFGMMDKYAVSEYSGFSSIKSGDTIKGWTLTDKRIEYETNPYFFVRAEVLFGINIKLTERFSLNLESGFAQGVNGRGPIPDKIYTNLDNAGYKLILSDKKDTEFPYFNSLSIFQRFTQKNNFINRFSLRYQIK